MVEAIKIWNEPNNLSHWDFTIDPEWKEFSEMARLAAISIRSVAPTVKIILGGISPIDPQFISLLASYGLMEYYDAVAIHGFPLDWNHWKIDEWPKKVKEIKNICKLPIWVTEVGASSFGAEEVQVFGLKRTNELLMNLVPNIFWYSLLDLPPTWEATTRHRESEGSAYYRHFYMGLIDANGKPKQAIKYFDPGMGICQWFHYEDHRLLFAIEWLKKLGVRKLRTGISWADWHRKNATKWFDFKMEKLKDFDTTITLCFTPPSRGKRATVTSPPVYPEEFAQFAGDIVKRYVVDPRYKTDKNMNLNSKK